MFGFLKRYQEELRTPDLVQKTSSVTGKCRWARVFECNRDYGFQEDGQYNIVLDLTKEAESQMKADGVTLNYKNGPEYVFRRNHTFLKDGIKVILGPPKVVDDNLKKLPEDTVIGNGSTVEILYRTYTPTTGKGKGKTSARLETVRVLFLVRYAQATARKSIATTSNIARNATCPCGSEKRYKHCCGALWHHL